MKTVITSPAAPEAIGPYSPGIATDRLIFLSGQIPLSPSGDMVGDTAAQQAEQVLKNITALLTAAGSSLERIVKATIFLTDLADFTAVNEVYMQHIPAPYPARSTFQVAALPKGAKVEIEVIALT